MAKRRTYRRKTNGQFARTGSSSARAKRSAPRSGTAKRVASAPAPSRAPTPKTVTAKQRRRRRVAVAGSVAVGAVLFASQAHPASRARTAPARRRLASAHVARARADHAKLSSLRASAFPTSALTARSFDVEAARREAAKLTAGYRGQVKAVRSARRVRR